MKRIEVEQRPGRVVIRRPADDKRLEALQKKPTKTPAEVQEEILLRLRAIEAQQARD